MKKRQGARKRECMRNWSGAALPVPGPHRQGPRTRQKSRTGFNSDRSESHHFFRGVIKQLPLLPLSVPITCMSWKDSKYCCFTEDFREIYQKNCKTYK